MHKPTRREADNFVHKWHLEQQRLVGIVVDTHLIDAPRTSTTTRSRRASPRARNQSLRLLPGLQRTATAAVVATAATATVTAAATTPPLTTGL